MRVYDVDLSMKSQHILKTNIILVADDEESNQLNIHLKDLDGIDVSDEYEILWLFRKRNRQSVAYTNEHIKLDNDTLSLVLTAKALNVVGSIESEIKFIKDDSVYTSQPFEIYVRKPINLIDVDNDVGITVGDIVNKLDEINDKYTDLLDTGGLSAEDREEIEQAVKDVNDIKDDVLDILERLENTDIDSLLDNIEEYSGELNKLSDKVLNHYEDIQHLSSNIEDINNTLTHTYNYIGTLNNDIEVLQAEVVALEEAYISLESLHIEDITVIREEVDSLLAKHNNALEIVESIVEDLKQQGELNEQYNNDIANIENEIKDLSLSFDSHDELLKELDSKIDLKYNDLAIDIETISSTIKKQQGKLNNVISDIATLLDKTSGNTDDIQTLNNNINGINDDIVSLRGLYNELLDSLSNITIPTKLSDLIDDIGIATKEDLDNIELPTEDLDVIRNDITLIKKHNIKQDEQLLDKVDRSEIADFITLDDIPDVDFVSLKEQIDTLQSKLQVALDKLEQVDIPTQLSDLENDSGFITLDDVPTVDLNPINEKISDLTIDINSKIDNLPTYGDLPTKLSELNNDTNYITIDSVPLDDIERTKKVILELGFDVDNLNTLLGNKVDKITGKGLSTNDFTNALKNKLEDIEEGANLYVHPKTHSADMVTETDDRQFVSHIDKDRWDNKANKEELIDVGKSIEDIQHKLSDKLDVILAEELFEKKDNKGQAGGYVGLNKDGKVPLQHLPDISKHQLFIVEEDDDKDTLEANKGDSVYITNTGDSYIYDGDNWIVLARADWENVNLDWYNISNAPKSSVEDIDKAVSNKHTHTNKDLIDNITSDNIDNWNVAHQHTLNGDIHVSLDEKSVWNAKADLDDIEALRDNVSIDIDDINKQYTALKEDVESKANKTDVLEDINRLQVNINNKAPILHKHSEYEKQLTSLERQIPTKLSELENNRGFITLRDIPKESVTSVNNKQGKVELFAGDIRYRLLSSATIYDKIEELFSDINSLRRSSVDKDDMQQALQNKANVEHNHITEDIVETDNKQFVSLHDKEQINTIQNKANKEDIPTRVGELTNDKGFITIDEIPKESVTSVNKQKGSVVLTGDNIHINDGATTTIKEELDYVKNIINNKIDKGSVVTSINGKQGDVELSGDDIRFNQWNSITEELKLKANVWDLVDKVDKGDVVTSINSQKGDVALTGSDINVSDGIDMPIDEAIFLVDDVLEEKANKADVDKELNNKIEWINNVSGKRVTLYGNMIDTRWGSNKTITEALEEKVNKGDVVTSVNGQKGDVTIDIDKVDTSQLEEDINNLEMSKAERIHTHSANDIAETTDKRFVTSRQLSDIHTISYLHTKKSDKDHTHSVDEFVHIGSSKPTDGRLWIEI